MANVSIRGLTKKFAEVAAVDDFHLEIGDGEFVSLLGPSGCGKTTTLRLLAGFLQPDGGEICAGGEVISSPAHLVPPERRQMSMIFQSYAVWPHMTSSTLRLNSGSSSRNNTPLWASETSPGFGTAPPPTNPASEIV